ncbi:MAG: glycine--tRNA ligase subunit beta [Sandaracinaceae bacterium]|jgi:glycyl-tRNA synthetase beta chain|nr:glycine--tRNA ligase subunit beta [Sandaracinaceae bacterium]MBP7683577.1 glycine--tRNA ligase subunit beta [Deltaproteobacteria bacterium]
MPNELLIEVGLEELPASFLKQALSSIEAAAHELLAGARLTPTSIEVLGSPRRIALRVRGLPERQPDRQEVVQGPPWAAAFDDAGVPKNGAVGFAKKQGVPVESLIAVETERGKYVAANVFEPGQEAKAVLPELLHTLCGRISFPKSMRWGEGTFAFGRPVHWLVGLFGADVVPFQFAGLTAGRSTRGHRFLAPDAFDLADASEYEARLAAAHVIVDMKQKKQRMHEALVAAATAAGGELLPDDFLLEECTSLVEEPFVVPGTIAQQFLELPDAVIVSVMRDHQRYFAVRKLDGSLLPTYLNVVNTALAPATIAKGNDRVLRARLADAQFFVREDRKVPLASRIARLDQVTFQTKLGSVGAKIRRVEQLARALAPAAGVPVDEASQVAMLCKMDLDALIVFEFPELQGLMGRFYALAEGLPAPIADAIADHYKPTGASDAPAPTALASVVAVADRADTLVGCFGIGLVPTGSADPFALRRATLSLVRTAVDGAIDVNITALLAAAYDGFPEGVLAPRAEVLAQLDEFVRARLRAFYRERFPGDVVDACVAAWPGGSVRDVQARIVAVDAFRTRPEYEALAVAFKRAHNITKDVARSEVSPALLEPGAEQALAEAWRGARALIATATAEGRYQDALAVVATDLRGPIDSFFETVFVMVEDEALRQNRLGLLAEIADTVSRVAHFHALST